ncbi:MAG: PP2C family protein-serine/threonine phosphatase [Candidatus Promineifilaceae bacterium]
MTHTGTTSVWRSAFQGLDERTLDALKEMAATRHYPEQTLLCRQGQVEHVMYVIIEGRVAIVQQLEDGEERLLNVRGPREYFGELALLDNTPRMANCLTLTPVRVLEVTASLFEEALAGSPALAYALMRHVVELLRATDSVAINDLTAKNNQLRLAYADLKAAQAELVEKERLERELEIAADVQRKLLPDQLPQLPDLALAAYLRPARYVGGDFYDAFEVDEQNLALVLADVADKGVQASLFMAVARTLFVGEGRRCPDPVEVTSKVHQGLFALAPSADIFITAFYGVLNRQSGVLNYVLAGHERPLLIRPARGVSALRGHGRFLGMLPELPLESFKARLRPGDRLLIFSDGAPDATNPAGDRFGHRRLRDFLRGNMTLPAQALLDGLTAKLNAWSAGRPAFDDVTLLALELRESIGAH